jgi:hypothetical protein
MKKTADFQAARGSKAGCGFCGGVPRVVKEMRRGGLPAFSCELFDRSVSMKISALRIFRRHRNGLLRIAMFEPPAVERDKGRYRFSETPSVKSESAKCLAMSIACWRKLANPCAR